jgi:prepilin-type N-terminal cleavage/methylation domain-containing protein
MRIRTNQSGFSAIELVIVVGVVAVLGLVGYMVYSRTMGQPTVATESATASDVSAAPTISSASDLDTALNVLNQNDPSAANNSDSSQLSTQMSAF